MEFELIASGRGFTEGPIVTPEGDILVTSMDHGVLYRITQDGEVTTFAEPEGGPNGATLGADGTVYVAQNGSTPPGVPGVHHSVPYPPPPPHITGGVQAVTADGAPRWVTRDMVAPNDLCFGPDGWLWVTDPTRRKDLTRMPARGDDGRLWRCHPETGVAELLLSVHWFPNGIGFDADADAVYVANTFEATIERYPLAGDGVLGPVETFVRMEYGFPDGFAFDQDGNLLIGAVSLDGPGELQVFDAAGTQVERLRPSESSLFTNVALSPDGLLVVTDADRGNVFVCRDWPTRGLPLFPFR